MKICIVFFDIHEYNIKFLTNIEIIEYVFVNETIAKIICERLQFRAINFSRLKHFNCFNENKIKFITHVIYSTLTIQNHNELIILMFITKIKFHFIILDKLWMNKHEIILNMKIDNLIFKRERYDHAKVLKKFKRDELSSFSRVFYLSSFFKFQMFISQIDSQKYIIMQRRSIFSISKMTFSKLTMKNALEEKIEISRDILSLDVSWVLLKIVEATSLSNEEIETFKKIFKKIFKRDQRTTNIRKIQKSKVLLKSSRRHIFKSSRRFKNVLFKSFDLKSLKKNHDENN